MKLTNIDNTLKYIHNKDGSYTFIFVYNITNYLNTEKLNFYFLNNK